MPILSNDFRLTDLFNKNPRQMQALQALGHYDFLLYGGAGGGGKSYFLRWGLVCLLIEWAAVLNLRGVRVGLFSQDYATLEDRQLSKIRKEFPAWLGHYREQRREFQLADALGGGTIAFRNLDDPSKYKSAEFAAVAVEELTENPEQTFHDLHWRMRWPGIERTKFLAATNPGGIGHAWVKRFWINRDFPPEMAKIAPQFKYIPAKATDNPFVAESYIEKLDSLPLSMRAAVRDGSWDVFSGQKFDEFKRDVHVVEPFAIPTWWRRWGANDPGYGDPATWFWMAADEDGNVYIYREATYQRIAPSEQARKVVALTGTESLDYWVTGMDAFVADKETGKSTVDYYADGGLFGCRRPVHGAGARAQRAQTWHEYLRPFDHPTQLGVKTSKVKIFANCAKLIETLPALVNDPNDAEAVAMCAIDHWYDGSGYGLQSRHVRGSEQPEAPVVEQGKAGAMLGMDEVFAPKDDKRPFKRVRG